MHTQTLESSELPVVDMTELEEYKQFVKRLADNESSFEFHNSGPSHASIVMANIFRVAEDTIRIYSGSMNPIVTNNPEYLKYLNQFLKNGGNVKLLLEKKGDEKSKAFNILSDWAASTEQVEIKQNIGIIASKDEARKQVIHFCTGDENSFRLELEPNNHIAQCCFDNTDMTANLNNNFDRFFE